MLEFLETMQLLSARPVVESREAALRARIASFEAKFSRKPHLAVVLVGDDPPSVIYTTKKAQDAQRLGLAHSTHRFAATSSVQEVRAKIDLLNADPSVDGILIQRPLPAHFKERDLVRWVDPKKDVDAFHPELLGSLLLGFPSLISCTPLGVIHLLEHYKIPIAGRVACVVGRSAIVGKPMAILLQSRDATVIQAHSKTKDLPSVTRQADLLIVAVGKRALIRAEHVKPGAVVVDVGIHRDAAGKLSGDVDFESVSNVAGALTPVPGGVGPMTILTLLENTVFAAESSSR
jgi:methylenetetrahydrofolate dehydrogenase (NADP+)/methenyltetrahydrofolate cyclohydrolase